MEANFFKGERLSRKKAKKIYTLATVTSGLYLLAKLLLWVGALFVFWQVIWQIPGATLKLIDKYEAYCTANALTISAEQTQEIEKLRTFFGGLLANRVGAFGFPISQILNFSALSGEKYEQVAWFLHLFKMLSIILLVLSPNAIPKLIKEIQYIIRGHRLPDRVYGENYRRNMRRFRESCQSKADAKKMLKWVDPNATDADGENVKQQLKQRYKAYAREVRINKVLFKKERRNFKRNPQSSADLSNVYYYKCIQTTAVLWGKDVEYHTRFEGDAVIKQERISRENTFFENFKPLVAPKKEKKYEKKFQKRKAMMNYINKKVRAYYTYGYSIAKSFNDAFRRSLLLCLTMVLGFVFFLGAIEGVLSFKVAFFKWFMMDLDGIWYLLLILVGVFFYFFCGILAGKVLNVERVEQDDYYRNLMKVGQDDRNAYFKEVGRIRKNTTIKRSILRRIPREYGLTIFVFRNICQILFTLIAFVLFAIIVKSQAQGFIPLLKFDTSESGLMPMICSLAGYLVMYFIMCCIFVAIRYAFSSNEFRVSTMREDRRARARISYKVPMLLLALCSIALLVCVILAGGAVTGQYILIGCLAFVGIVAATADWLLKPRDPDEDVGVDFFFNDNNTRDPDDGVYQP